MAPRTFKKMVIAVSGTFPGFKQSDVKELIEAQGATFSTSVNDQCTHLITTSKDVEKNSSKYQAASKSTTCHVVSLDWLTESSKGKKPLAEKVYLLGAGAGSGQSTAAPQVAPKKSNMNALKNGNGKDLTADSEKTGQKRALKQEDESAEKPIKKQKDSESSISKQLVIPVDEGFTSSVSSYLDPRVHIDDTGLIWDATLNQTVASNNNNKFYRLQIVADKKGRFIAWTRWGRVGEHGQSAAVGDGSLKTAEMAFKKKFREKSGLAWENRLELPKNNKYTFIERNYEEDDEEEEIKKPIKEEPDEQKPEVKCTLSNPLQNLMSFIFNQDHFYSAMASMSYDAKKLPLGKLSDRTLKAGFSTLKELAELLADPALATPRYNMGYGPAIESLSNRYFTTIPHVFGRNRPPILNSDAQIKKEIELLEALTDMDVANEILKDSKQVSDIHELDRQFQSLGMEEMTSLEHDSTEFHELSSYLLNSRGATHHLKYTIIDIFRIERRGENARFSSSSFADLKNSDRRLLWHGSRSSNFGGILSQGLRIAPPEAPVNGYMFGKGVYLADTSTKSANYCCSSTSANMGLLLLCDTELGEPMLELCIGEYKAGEIARKEGKIATLGKGQTIPGGWKDAAAVNPVLEGVKLPDVSRGSIPCKDDHNPWLQYNEYIVYDVAQIRQRYLFYVRMD
ncbi:hypothetical protein N7462_000684 [Penicillium macrosclerotiorum]|uniref:uncharacterized protein n=1 Tax=Penicillium macrosclerotiorum TaxID=303699 RepID=UPI002546C3EB|nr:uncharacterized protein N7462_000684 [Penicillium macrosclerotiorum]KAJ5698679.1 hypothetical protein N7462_000684 [Penicillium macrosclerotiorum]